MKIKMKIKKKRIDSVDSSLRSGGRFDREIRVKIPDKQTRKKILKIQTRNVKLEADFDFDLVAHKTPG